MDHEAEAFALTTLADWAQSHGLLQIRHALEKAHELAAGAADNVELEQGLRAIAAGEHQGPEEDPPAPVVITEEVAPGPPAADKKTAGRNKAEG